MKNNSKFIISNSNNIKKHKEKMIIEETPKIDSQKYHSEEIKQNKMIVKNAILMIWVGIALIIASFIVYVLKITDSLVSGTICGCFIDLLSATILYLFNKSNENKINYFNNILYNESEEKIIELVNSTKNQDLKEELVHKLMDHHLKKTD